MRSFLSHDEACSKKKKNYGWRTAPTTNLVVVDCIPIRRDRDSMASTTGWWYAVGVAWVSLLFSFHCLACCARDSMASTTGWWYAVVVGWVSISLLCWISHG